MDIESAALSDPIFDPLFCTPQVVDDSIPATVPAEDGSAGEPDK